MADDPSLPSNTTTLASPPASPPSTSRPDETVNLHIKMVADPAKKESGSERAVAAYEKRRVFRVNRVSHLQAYRPRNESSSRADLIAGSADSGSRRSGRPSHPAAQ